MIDFIIEVETTGREVYTISAPTAEEAKRILYQDAPRPTVSEVLSLEITSVEEQS